MFKTIGKLVLSSALCFSVLCQESQVQKEQPLPWYKTTIAQLSILGVATTVFYVFYSKNNPIKLYQKKTSRDRRHAKATELKQLIRLAINFLGTMSEHESGQTDVLHDISKYSKLFELQIDRKVEEGLKNKLLEDQKRISLIKNNIVRLQALLNDLEVGSIDIDDIKDETIESIRAIAQGKIMHPIIA